LFYNPGQTWLSIDLAEINSNRKLSRRIKDQSSRDLFASLSTTLNKDDRDHTWFILWQRMSMAFATIPLALIGAMLGWRLRKGGFVASFSSALSFLLLVYYPLFFLCDNLEEVDALSPFIAAWLPAVLLVPIVVLMLRHHRTS
jgi:lipopolysaccharide export LptBFGC system permease protein LptF